MDIIVYNKEKIDCLTKFIKSKNGIGDKFALANQVKEKFGLIKERSVLPKFLKLGGSISHGFKIQFSTNSVFYHRVLANLAASLILLFCMCPNDISLLDSQDQCFHYIHLTLLSDSL